jgi:hypothetical protein
VGESHAPTSLWPAWTGQCEEDSPLKQKPSLRWSLWACIFGMGSALFVVVLFRITHAQFIYRLFTSVDRLAFVTATVLTSWVFPRDRLQRGVSIATFFDLILITATGVQCAVVGFILGLLATRAAPRPAMK